MRVYKESRVPEEIVVLEDEVKYSTEIFVGREDDGELIGVVGLIPIMLTASDRFIWMKMVRRPTLSELKEFFRGLDYFTHCHIRLVALGKAKDRRWMQFLGFTQVYSTHDQILYERTV